jgi:hypothetical protein
MSYFSKVKIQGSEDSGSYPDPSSVPTGNFVDGNVDAYGNLRTRGEILTDELSIRDDFSGVALGADWTATTSGGTITVANSVVEIVSGTVSGNKPSIVQDVDYCPVTLRGRFKLGGRYANQKFRFGFIYRDGGVITQGAYLEFSGTDNTLVNTVTCSSDDATDFETYSDVLIPLSLTTADYNYWKIDVSNNTVTFSISDDGLNFQYITQHKLHLPDPYQGLPLEISFDNTGTATSNTGYVDMIFVNNMNRVQIDQDFAFEPLPTQILGRTDSGQALPIPVTPEGHLETAIHEPLTVFGEVSVAQDTPIFQSDFVYGLNNQQTLSVTSGSGTGTASNGLATLTTGTTIYSYSVLESRKRLRYRPGQGVKVKFTALYSNPVANSYQGVGCGTAENGLYFGYGNTSDLSDTRFGILYVRGGIREIKTLTVTAGASSSGNVTVTLNGTAFNVAVTNSSNIQRTTWEIAQGTFTGWDAYPKGATVVFVRKSAGVTAGTQSFSAGATGSTATITQTRAGVASTDTFIAQEDWNVDRCDGSKTKENPSGFSINPQKINIYRFKIGYLGAHDIICQIKMTPPNANNSIWQTVHVIKYANLNTQVSFTNASFPFNAFAYSAGSTTDLSVKVGSFAGVIEGKKYLIGPRATYVNALTTVGASNYQALFTILNPRVYGNVSNQTVINVQSFSGALKHTSPCVYYIIKNGSLVGNPNFNTYSANTCGLYDTAATTVTFATNDQLLYTFHLGDTGEVDHHFVNGELNGDEFTIQPGEWITVAAKSVTGTPSYVTGSFNTREDQ